MRDSRLVTRLDELPFPVLAVARRPVGEAPYVTMDDIYAGRLAAEHLLRLHGCRRFVYLGGPRGGQAREDRVAGARGAVDEWPAAHFVGDYDGLVSIDDGIRLGQELLHSGLDFDAVLCHSDLIAYSVEAALQGAGRGDVAVIGFDGLAESKVFSPPITSVAIGPTRLGAEAVDWLLRSIDGLDAERHTDLQPHLEIRNSCGCAS